MENQINCYMMLCKNWINGYPHCDADETGICSFDPIEEEEDD